MYKYRFIIVPIIAVLICQIIKFLIESIKYKKVMIARLLNGAGGFPSSHTTFSMTLASFIGLELGFNDPLFAAVLIFSLIVIYDAVGVRYESGKQATAINDIVEQLNNKKFKAGFEILKEQIGHKPVEVFAGIILAWTLSFLFHTFIF